MFEFIYAHTEFTIKMTINRVRISAKEAGLDKREEAKGALKNEGKQETEHNSNSRAFNARIECFRID